jgi:hypothetical protein
MINSVRNTVLAIANKNNYGYIAPQDFNLYAQQAQMDLFEDYFYQYNSWIVKQNQRVSGTGYADIVKSLVEVIDEFSVTKGLIKQGNSMYFLPDDYYFISKINNYPNFITSGTNNLNSVNNLVGDSTAAFAASGVLPGQIIVNTTAGSTYKGFSAYVVSVDSLTQLTLSSNIFPVTVPASASGNTYSIFTTAGIVEAERVNQNKIFYLNNSPLTAPSVGYPAYVLGGATTGITGDSTTGKVGNSITVYPTSLTTGGSMIAEYVRYPLPPNWTYASVLAGGAPVFNSAAADYQDFELPLSDEPGLVAKICQYIGIEIREPAVHQFGIQEIAEDNQTQG